MCQCLDMTNTKYCDKQKRQNRIVSWSETQLQYIWDTFKGTAVLALEEATIFAVKPLETFQLEAAL